MGKNGIGKLLLKTKKDRIFEQKAEKYTIDENNILYLKVLKDNNSLELFKI